MKKILVFLFSILLIGAGCSKDEKDPDSGCAVGEVRFVNNSNNPYTLQVDNFSGTVQGKTYQIVELREGKHAWYVKQQSGYLLYPTERNGNVSVFGCDEYVVNFP